MIALVFVARPGFVLVSLAVLVFAIWVAVDASKYPEWAFQQAGTQKWVYQVIAPISALLCGIVAIVVGIMWFASKKAQVEQAARGGGDGGLPPGPYGTGPPPQPPTWGSPPPPPPGPGPSTPPPPAAD